jgi:hypothetical protein
MKRKLLKIRLYKSTSGLDGRSILVERGAEVQEGGRVLLEALRNRDPGHLEKVRTRLGQWRGSQRATKTKGIRGWTRGERGKSGRAGRRSSRLGVQWAPLRPLCVWFERTGTGCGVRWR